MNHSVTVKVWESWCQMADTTKNYDRKVGEKKKKERRRTKTNGWKFK